jgi:hypothetical protein
MPWVKIPPKRLKDVPLFGIDFLRDDDDPAYAWYRGSRGRMRVEKANPYIFFEDVADAIQLDAIGIIMGVADDDPSVAE